MTTIQSETQQQSLPLDAGCLVLLAITLLGVLPFAATIYMVLAVGTTLPVIIDASYLAQAGAIIGASLIITTSAIGTWRGNNLARIALVTAVTLIFIGMTAYNLLNDAAGQYDAPVIVISGIAFALLAVICFFAARNGNSRIRKTALPIFVIIMLLGSVLQFGSETLSDVRIVARSHEWWDVFGLLFCFPLLYIWKFNEPWTKAYYR